MPGFDYLNAGQENIPQPMANANAVASDPRLQSSTINKLTGQDIEKASNIAAADFDWERTSKYNSAEAQLGREFTALQNQMNRDYTERMSNTAYQRAKEI